MQTIIDLLGGGFLVALKPECILAMVAGTVLGSIFGALPGLSATTGMALLLPIAYQLDLNVGLLLLAGIYCGALYGGSISAILLGIPGTAAALPTTFDGFPMSKGGRGSEALLCGLYGSSFGGVFSALVLMFLTPIVSRVAILLGTPELFALSVWGMAIVASVVGDDWVKGIFSAALGLLVATVGADPINGSPRFTFGSYYLLGGFALVPMILGMLALPRVYSMIESFRISEEAYFQPARERKYFLKPSYVLKQFLMLLRSAVIGTFVGIAPAAGPTIAAFMSYNSAKSSDQDPESFGKGNPKGVLAAECANNAAVGGSLVLTLSLGIPGSTAAAVLMSALIMRGVQPGPMLLQSKANVVYTFFAGFLLVNIIVFFVGHLFVQAGHYVLKTPAKLLAPIIVVICVIGAYSESNNMFNVYVMVIASVFAYIMDKAKIPTAPFLLALVLGNMLEANFWAAYTITFGKPWMFFTRPMFLLIFLLALVTLFMPALKKIVNKKHQK